MQHRASRKKIKSKPIKISGRATQVQILILELLPEKVCPAKRENREIGHPAISIALNKVQPTLHLSFDVPLHRAVPLQVHHDRKLFGQPDAQAQPPEQAKDRACQQE